jgi:membrane fusion protein (multidrug efflux system)
MALMGNVRVRVGIGVLVLAIAGVVTWFWLTSASETTDDAQVDGHVTQISARVSGVVQKVLVDDNRQVEADTVLVEIDPRDYQVAVDRARAALADAQASAVAAQVNVPITSTGTSSTLSSAHATLARSADGVTAAQKQVDAARARVASAQAKLREAEANSGKSARDVERLRGLLAKDEVSQQQFDATAAAADAARAASDSSKSQVAEAEAGVPVAESQLAQALAVQRQAEAELESAKTAPQQMTQSRARAEASQAQVKQAKAALELAELNWQRTTIRALVKGIVSRKSVEVGQFVQPGQPLMAIIPLENLWITANFKETQLRDMRPGQKAAVKVDANGREYRGHVDSISAATGARFSMLPPENATGNYVKVVQRVPVKIVLEPGEDQDHLLRPGLSVEPTVYTR